MSLGPGARRQSVTESLYRLLRRMVPALLALSFLAPALGPVRAEETTDPEFQFKAAFIYHFTQFVEWPPTAFAQPNSPFVIGVLGRNPFGNALKHAVEGKSLNEHPFAVKEFTSAAQARQEGVQILFISASEEKHFPEIAKALQGASVLTVVNKLDHFLDSGFIINFIAEGQKIRFQISEPTAAAAHLKISAKLLSLASRPTR